MNFNSHTDVVIRVAVDLVNLLTPGEERGRRYAPPEADERTAAVGAVLRAVTTDDAARLVAALLDIGTGPIERASTSNDQRNVPASTGVGSASHLAAELFKSMAGVDLLHVPYKGSSPALTDVITGQVSAMIVNMPPAVPFVKAGKLRALAVTSAARRTAAACGTAS